MDSFKKEKCSCFCEFSLAWQTNQRGYVAMCNIWDTLYSRNRRTDCRNCWKLGIVGGRKWVWSRRRFEELCWTWTVGWERKGERGISSCFILKSFFSALYFSICVSPSSLMYAELILNMFSHLWAYSLGEKFLILGLGGPVCPACPPFFVLFTSVLDPHFPKRGATDLGIF